MSFGSLPEIDVSTCRGGLCRLDLYLELMSPPVKVGYVVWIFTWIWCLHPSRWAMLFGALPGNNVFTYQSGLCRLELHLKIMSPPAKVSYVVWSLHGEWSLHLSRQVMFSWADDTSACQRMLYLPLLYLGDITFICQGTLRPLEIYLEDVTSICQGTLCSLEIYLEDDTSIYQGTSSSSSSSIP